MSTSPRPPCRTSIASMRSRASWRARARRISWSPTGAELEIGWLPVLLQESGNGKIQPGGPGYFEAAAQLRLLEVPTERGSLDGRHPSAGQSAPASRSAQHRDRRHGADDEARHARCRQRAVLSAARRGLSRRAGKQAIDTLGSEAAPLKGVRGGGDPSRSGVSVPLAGAARSFAAIEPKPGVPPSAGYLARARHEAQRRRRRR